MQLYKLAYEKWDFQKDQLILLLLKSIIFNRAFTPGLKDKNLTSTQVWKEAPNLSEGHRNGAVPNIELWKPECKAHLTSTTGTHLLWSTAPCNLKMGITFWLHLKPGGILEDLSLLFGCNGSRVSELSLGRHLLFFQNLS